jgi:hypothetical protein
MENVRIAVITAPRPNGKSTLETTLRSVRDSDASKTQLGVFSDSVDAPAGSELADETRLQTAEHLALIKPNKWYGTTNLIRAWRWAAAGAEWIVSLEDDLLFPAYWFAKALDIAAKLSQPAVLSLHDMCTFAQLQAQYELVEPVPFVEGVGLWRATDHVWPNGSQAYVMRSSLAIKLAAVLEEKIITLPVEDRYAWVMDCGVISAREAGLFDLYQTDPCFCEHLDFGGCTWMSNRNPELSRTKRFRAF